LKAWRWQAWALAAILAAGAFLRLFRLGSESLWVDEAYSLSVARESLGEILLHHDNTPPLYNLVLHLWIGVAGTSEWALRLPSAAFGTAAVALTFPVARRIAGERAALVATALHAASFYLWSTGQEARAYALTILLAVASFHFFLRLVERRSGRDAVAYVAVSALLLYSHVLGILWLAAQALHLALVAGPEAPRGRMFGAQAAAVACFLPWTPILLRQAPGVVGDFWRAPANLDGLLATAVWLAGSKWLAAALGSLLAGAVVALRVWRRPAGGPELQRWRNLWLALLWLGVPVAGLFAVGLVVHIYRPKYLLASAVPLYVLAAWALLLVRPRLARAGASVVLAALLLAPVVIYHTGQEPAMHRDDWRGVVRDLDSVAHHGDLVVFNRGVCDGSGGDRLCPFHYYTNRSDLRLAPLDDPARLAALVANESRVWLVQGFFSDGDRVLPGLAGNFTLVADHQHPGVRVRGFERSAGRA
jgi:uncharacterized membrane protein